MTLGERIAEIRRSRGVTQEELAQEIGVSRQSIYKYETDRADPRLFITTCIADVLGVTIDCLVRGGDYEI